MEKTLERIALALCTEFQLPHVREHSEFTPVLRAETPQRDVSMLYQAIPMDSSYELHLNIQRQFPEHTMEFFSYIVDHRGRSLCYGSESLLLSFQTFGMLKATHADLIGKSLFLSSIYDSMERLRKEHEHATKLSDHMMVVLPAKNENADEVCRFFLTQFIKGQTQLRQPAYRRTSMAISEEAFYQLGRPPLS